nr:unnamed protein product [Callosobruchus analis]
MGPQLVVQLSISDLNTIANLNSTDDKTEETTSPCIQQ